MTNENERYLSRSWELLTRDKGWIKPVLVLAVSLFVPIAGVLGLNGYALEWARLTAWGVDAAPKQKGVRVGECIKSGWRGFLALAGYACAFTLLSSLISGLFNNGSFIELLLALLGAFMGIVYMVVSLRATIYQRVGAGYQVNRVWELVQRDPVGLLKIAGMMVLLELATGLVVGVLVAVVLIGAFARLAGSAFMYGVGAGYSGVSERLVVAEVLNALASAAPALVLISFVGMVAAVIISLLSHTAVGLWMRQFDVQAWGGSSDPLPVRGGLPEAGPAPAAPTYAQSAPAQTWQTQPAATSAAEPTAAPVATPEPTATPAPVAPVEPAAATEPVMPVQPVAAAPDAPAAPAAPDALSEQAEAATPAVPVTEPAPVQPAVAAPVAPVEPVASAAPVAPEPVVADTAAAVEPEPVVVPVEPAPAAQVEPVAAVPVAPASPLDATVMPAAPEVQEESEGVADEVIVVEQVLTRPAAPEPPTSEEPPAAIEVVREDTATEQADAAAAEPAAPEVPGEE